MQKGAGYYYPEKKAEQPVPTDVPFDAELEVQQGPSQIAPAGTTYVNDSGEVVGISDGETIVPLTDPSEADLDAIAAEQAAKEATAGDGGILAGTTPPADAPRIDISVDKISGTVTVNGDPERPKAEGEPAAESEPSLGGTEPA